MNVYKKIMKPLLFRFEPEAAHHFVFSFLKILMNIPGMSYIMKAIYEVKDQRLEKTVLGLKFSNPVGLAAGFDKDAKLYDELSNFGFGFIEVGTLTPTGQEGNARPRMFRLLEDDALINRMGFNNEGVYAAEERLKDRKSKVIIGGNIGKNKITPNDEAISDYIKCFEALFCDVDYFVVNVSSPNTPNLRALQEKEPLKALLTKLKELNIKLATQYTRQGTENSFAKPILLKIAPDLTNEQLDDIIEIVKTTKIEGVIATNTTISRSGLKTPKGTIELYAAGGLSGKPLANRATEVIRYLSEKSNKSFTIIGVGGIHSAEDALEKLSAGADLIQIYTGFIYEGPGLVKKINQGILARMN
jgi:dihydroorotate dehydrogenase